MRPGKLYSSFDQKPGFGRTWLDLRPSVKQEVGLRSLSNHILPPVILTNEQKQDSRFTSAKKTQSEIREGEGPATVLDGGRGVVET